MAFTDNALNGRVVEAIGPRYPVTLGAACEVGDLLCYNSGWKLANAGAAATADAVLVALSKGASADVIKASPEAIISGLTAGTAGNSIYANTIGGYTSTAGTIPVVVGFELGGGAVYVAPKATLGGQIVKEDTMLYFGDVGVSITSTGDGMMKIAADHTTSAAAITLSDPTTFSDNVTLSDAKSLYLQGTGAYLTSTADKVMKVVAGSATGLGMSFQVTCTTGAAKVMEAVGATGTAPKLAFFGATPVVQQATIAASTGGNTTVDKIIAVLDAFGLTATA